MLQTSQTAVLCPASFYSRRQSPTLPISCQYSFQPGFMSWNNTETALSCSDEWMICSQGREINLYTSYCSSLFHLIYNASALPPRSAGGEQKQLGRAPLRQNPEGHCEQFFLLLQSLHLWKSTRHRPFFHIIQNLYEAFDRAGTMSVNCSDNAQSPHVKNINGTVFQLTQCLVKISTCMKRNKLSLNLGKTEVKLLGRGRCFR